MYELLRFLAFFMLRIGFRLKIIGAKNYRGIEGGYIAMCNHTSNWDPLVLGYAIKHRPVCYMAKEELFKSKAGRFAMKHLHAIPIARGAGDIGAVKTGLRSLAEGKILGIFPEGTRHHEMPLGHFEPGAAMLALRSGVPVLPAYISGTYKFLHRVTIRFGQPIDLRAEFPGKINSALIHSATDRLREAMMELVKESGA